MICLPGKQNHKSKPVKQKDAGFTLIEVMAVLIILAVMAAIAIPKVASSSEAARKNADITTGHEVKSALDFYLVQTGRYPTNTEMTASGGVVSCTAFVPAYVAKLDTKTTQQSIAEANRGFEVITLTSTGSIPATPSPSHLIVIYLNASGTAAEVRTLDATDLTKVLWSSAD
ncbi:MAG: prepilin-type N-terminal cleavage/methylation domain-containing protein [Peptococcaceae bacterium]|jgi:general secretion pathway protein G|nr:prepilin-type N-terminal cleavage/methylation domain-containing protein [Peptococcaceae bacterium]